MAILNPSLFNSALAGSLGGSQQRWITNPTEAAYEGVQAVAIAVATAVDEALGAQSGVTTAQANLLQSIAQGIMTSRYPSSDDKTAYEAIATAIAAMFLQLKTGLDPADSHTVIGDDNSMAYYDASGNISSDPLFIGNGLIGGNPGIHDYRAGNPLWTVGGAVLRGDPVDQLGFGISIVNPDNGTPGEYNEMRYWIDSISLIEGIGGTQNLRFHVNNQGMSLRDDAGDMYAQFFAPEKRVWFENLNITSSIGARPISGTADPNGLVSGSYGDIYLRQSSTFGAQLYIKRGTASTSGWERVSGDPVTSDTTSTAGDHTLDIAQAGVDSIADVINITGAPAALAVIQGISTAGVPDGHEMTLNIEGGGDLEYGVALGAGLAGFVAPGAPAGTATYPVQTSLRVTYYTAGNIWRCNIAGV